MNRPLAVVTGASGGIGKELAILLARDQYDLVLVARSGDKLASLAKELMDTHGVNARVEAYDLAAPGTVEKLVTALGDDIGRLEVLVNNAGYGSYGEFWKGERDEQLGMVDLNIRALTELTHAVLPGMVARKRGRILNVASTAAFQSGPLMSVYYATKAYVLSFSEGLSEELRGTGVTVTALCPGPTRSDFQTRSHMQQIRLVAGRTLPSSAHVAAVGYQAMQLGKPLVIEGVLNTLSAFVLSRVLPRSWARRLVWQAHQRV